MNESTFELSRKVEQVIFGQALSFLPADEWELRRSAIEAHLEALFAPPSAAEVDRFYRLIGTEDRIAWYLYLVQTSQHEPFRTEVHQASRVLPVFKKLGADLTQLLKIHGIDAQAVKLLGASKDQPDSVLFEMLVALLWANNGWKDVSFVRPGPADKRPDIRAANNGDEWFIETKRMVATSEYSRKERDKWLRMWTALKDCLIRNQYPFVLDITFHVELTGLEDNFLVKNLEKRLKFVAVPCLLLANEICDVHVNFIDFEKISKHLEQQHVKHHSRQLQELIGGSWERKKGFTFVMSSSNVRFGGERGINQYVSEIEWAAGAYWHCDAKRAIEAKARDVRRHLSEAVEQLPSNGRGAIHFGIETFDGEEVEAERFARIVNTVTTFDARGKDLRWVYAHLYESYSPPTESWFFDETVYRFGVGQAVNSEPILKQYTVVPSDKGGIPGAHWLREAP